MAVSKIAESASASASGQAVAANVSCQTEPSLVRPVARTRRVAAPTWSCLVVAEDQQRRAHFQSAASRAGWRPISCGSIGEAVRASDRWKTQLALIDLGRMSPVRKSSFLSFAGKIADRERLLMISDEPIDDSPEVELYTRQIGVWLYLSSPDLNGDLEDLLVEARGVAEKLWADPTHVR